jgi:hypothetical protein
MSPELDRSHRFISDSVGIGVSTVGSMVRRAAAASLTWSEARRSRTTNWKRGSIRRLPWRTRGTGLCPTGPPSTWSASGPGVTLELRQPEYLQRQPAAPK